MATAKENLDRQVGEGNANAIEALIDEKLQQRSEDFEGLRQEFVTLRDQIGDIPELKRQLASAGALLRDAIDDHNNLVDRRNAGEPVSESEVVEDEERVQRVSNDLGLVRDELEQRVTAIEERLDDENTGLAALHNRDDELQAQIDEIRDTQSTETTEVRSSKAVWLALLITFAAVFVFAWLWIMDTNDNESWLWAVAWAGVLAGLVAALVGVATKEGTRTNTFLGDLRNTRRSRQERQQADVDAQPPRGCASRRAARAGECMRNPRGVVVGILMLGGSLMLMLLLGFGGGTVANGSLPDGEEPSDGATTESPPPEPCSVQEAIQDDLLERGFEIGDFSVDDTVWSQDPLDNVGGAFHGRIESRRELSRFLRSDAPESRAARDKILGEIPSDERVRALSGNGYMTVQFHVPVDYTGNSMWNGDRVITPNGVKRAKSGDVVWVYVTQDCDVVWSASVRADCGNVGYHRLIPVRKD